MHIPSSMLHGQVCPVTLSVGVVGVGLAAYYARRQEQKPSAVKFSAIAALVFALQMLNYPVLNGTSGHLVGAMLAVSFLGVPFAVLAMTIVLAVQAVLFGDGGVNALGANIINMAFLGAGLAGFLLNRMTQKGVSRPLALGLGALMSVILGAVACSFEVAFSGVVALNKVLPAMLSVHLLIGLGESILTVLVVSAFKSFYLKEKTFAAGSFALAIMAASLSPFASRLPDGLEWVAGTLSFKQFSGWNTPVLFPDYQTAFIHQTGYSTIIAGLLGVGIVSAVTFLAGRIVLARRRIVS
ncbi:MAG: energy-coupling factor ABC transporter permease [Candidatus Omnitrophica bacterium]|nr:energy-coupling factor ABC transporter permease [Candidatus Omnitrophota bacterium]